MTTMALSSQIYSQTSWTKSNLQDR